MEQRTELTVRLEVAGIDPDHPLAEQAYEEFTEDAYSVAGLRVEERGTPVVGQKGVLTELALILAAPRSGSAVVNLLKLWLERDQRRSVEVTVTQPGQEPFTVRASGEKISLGVLEGSLKTAVQSMTAQPPTAGGSDGMTSG